MDELNKEDKAVIYKIIRDMPDSKDRRHKPCSRFKRAREAYIWSLSVGTTRRVAFHYACYEAACGDSGHCFMAIDAIRTIPEYAEI